MRLSNLTPSEKRNHRVTVVPFFIRETKRGFRSPKASFLLFLKHEMSDQNIFASTSSNASDASAFALGASSGGEFFFENQKICVIEPVFDAEYIAPEIVPVRLKKGYNILTAKCVLGQTPLQYRRVWGAMAQAFCLDK